MKTDKQAKQSSLAFKATKATTTPYKVVKGKSTIQDIKPQVKPQVKRVELEEKKIEVKPESKLTELNPNDPKYASELKKETAIKKSIAPDVHPAVTDDAEKILKNFDFTMDFGPVVGVSRLERWERASKLGLKPPAIVKEILDTRQGHEDASYRDSFLHGHLV